MKENNLQPRLLYPAMILSLIKHSRPYNGEKTISSTSGAGKTGKLCTKDETRALSNTIHKNKLKMD